jgi:hypothetical protein
MWQIKRNAIINKLIYSGGKESPLETGRMLAIHVLYNKCVIYECIAFPLLRFEVSPEGNERKIYFC